MKHDYDEVYISPELSHTVSSSSFSSSSLIQVFRLYYRAQ
jgi:hypothetical protein